MRLEVSKVDIVNGDVDWKVLRLNDTYLLKVLRFANKLGLEGKKIKEVVKVEPTFMDAIYIDFICESEERHDKAN